MEDLPNLKDDGLVTPVVQDWAVEKYQHFRHYAQMFTTSMKKKWELVYVDLFAGAGRARIESTGRIVPNAAGLALGFPFQRFVFCERDEGKLDALKRRVQTVTPKGQATFLCGDTNSLLEEILRAIPRGSRDHRVLSFCFVDPYKCSSLKFATIQRLAERYVDFLILIPSDMDAHRNLHNYVEDSRILDEFLGDTGWRDNWRSLSAELPKAKFGQFVADEFGRQMKALGYLYEDLSEMHLMRSTAKNLPLYRLCAFSRNDLGAKFWREAKAATNAQPSLFE